MAMLLLMELRLWAFWATSAHCYLMLNISLYFNQFFFLTLSDLAQLVQALKKLALGNRLTFHRKEKVFVDKGIVESVKHHKTPVKFHLLTEEKQKLLYILFLKLIEIPVFL